MRERNKFTKPRDPRRNELTRIEWKYLGNLMKKSGNSEQSLGMSSKKDQILTYHQRRTYLSKWDWITILGHCSSGF